MIKKIKKIKNLLIFNDCSWDNNLPEFKQYNLIYGWNGSGKTTLTDLFAAIEKGASNKYPHLEYQIETESGSIRQGEALSRKVRVFNEDYISNNVQLLLGKAKSINIILGKENKKIVEEIERDEQSLNEKKEKLKEITNKKESLKGQKGDKFTNIATVISSFESGQATRNYRKNNAEAAFLILSTKELLEEADIKKHQLMLQQQIKDPLTELTIPQLKYQEDEELDLDDLLEKINIEGKNLCAQTVVSKTIKRLKEYDDISQWVEAGIRLHEKHKSQKCEYCDRPLPEKRIKELAEYFNEADKKLKRGIDELIKELERVSSAIKKIVAKDKANLYQEICPAYQSTIETLENEKTDILKIIGDLCKSLKGKKSKTTEFVKLEINIDINPFITVIEQVNIEIRKHNTKTNNFVNEKKIAREKLEKHYLSTIYDEVKDSEARIKNYENEITKLEIGISVFESTIDENKAKISSSHKACEEINEGLRTFLGRDEITFEVAGDGEEGYLIKRNGKIAYNLSEGENNAIAFVYFIVHLQDDFDIKKGIVVIDDPVSSLDSNSIFQAFSFLKNTVKDAHQVFLFTHNFDFLRLLLNWLNYRAYKDCRSYYMLTNRYIDGDRSVEISELDKLLKDHESEYHYLFKRLYEFTSDGSIESVYHIPNLARKVLDTFLMFRVPNSKNIYGKLRELPFDENKKTAIYKFTNVQSHITGKGFDPSLVPETQKNVEYLLEMIDEVFPQHYKILVESISN